MNYIIQAPSARRLKQEILDSVAAKVDANGKGISSWQRVETDDGEYVQYILSTNGQRRAVSF